MSGGGTREDFTPVRRSLTESDRVSPANAESDPSAADADAGADPISLEIMGSEYRVAAQAEERDALLAAAEHLNNTMEDIRGTGKVLGVDRIAVMAALNISYDLLAAQQQLEQQEVAFNDRLERLLRQVDIVLSKLRENGV